MKKIKSLKSSFLINTILATIIPVLVIALVILPIIEENLVSEDMERSHLLATSITESIYNATQQQINMLNRVNEQVIVKKFIRPEDINNYLDSIVQEDDNLKSILILNKQGTVLHANQDSKVYIGMDMSNEAFFQELKESKKTVWSPVYYVADTSSITILSRYLRKSI